MTKGGTVLMRVVLIVAVVAFNDLALSSPAHTQTRGTAHGQGTVDVGTWAAVARSVNSSTTSGATPITFTWTGSTRGTTLYRYIELANVGTFSLSGTSVSVPIGTWAGSTGQTIGTVTFKTCSGTWNTATNGCSGTTTVIATITNPLTTAGNFSTSSTLVSGTPLPIQVSVVANKSGTYTITPRVSITRSRVRAGQTHSS